MLLLVKPPAFPSRELFLAQELAAGPICRVTIGPFRTRIVRPMAQALLNIAEKCARGNPAANRLRKDHP